MDYTNDSSDLSLPTLEFRREIHARYHSWQQDSISELESDERDLDAPRMISTARERKVKIVGALEIAGESVLGYREIGLGERFFAAMVRHRYMLHVVCITTAKNYNKIN